MISRALARKLRQYIEKAVISLSDEDALEAVELYPAWRTGTVYKAKTDDAPADRIRYGETLYRCVQSHTSQDDWTPDKTPALWTVVSLDEWPEWVQPTGAQDAYDFGAKVSHLGKHWVSNAGGNVWEPGVYGWTEV